MTKPPKDSPAGRLSRAVDNWILDPLDALAAVVELRADLTEAEDSAALMARRLGCTWQQIGDTLGITRQRAHQRWNCLDGSALPDHPPPRLYQQ